MRPLTLAAAAALLTAGAVLAGAAWGVLARERALDRAAGPADQDSLRDAWLRSISPDGEL